MCVPANALANYLEEGDLKLMHTLHNQLNPPQRPTKNLNINQTFFQFYIFAKFLH